MSVSSIVASRVISDSANKVTDADKIGLGSVPGSCVNGSQLVGECRGGSRGPQDNRLGRVIWDSYFDCVKPAREQQIGGVK